MRRIERVVIEEWYAADRDRRALLSRTNFCSKF